MNRRNFKMPDHNEELLAHESIQRRACQIYLERDCVFTFPVAPSENCEGKITN
jgi:hypothetical protein